MYEHLSRWAIFVGVPDPVAAAQDVLTADTASLRAWFAVARRLEVRLWQGAAALLDARAVLGAAWSAEAPRHLLDQLSEAALASREVLTAQTGAADGCAAVLDQASTLTVRAFDAATVSLVALGRDPAEGLNVTARALQEGQQEPVAAILTSLSEEVTRLNGLAVASLGELQHALAGDPLDPVERLPTSLPGGGRLGTGLAGRAAAAGELDAGLRAQLAADAAAGSAAGINARGILDAVGQAEAGGEQVTVLAYEPASPGQQGRAAVALGALHTADHVALLVPGSFSSATRMTTGVEHAAALRAGAAVASPGDETAVVAWYGYDTPGSAWTDGTAVSSVPGGAALLAIGDSLPLLDDAAAAVGGEELAADVGAFRALAAPSAHFSAVGFSMGATTLSHAAEQNADLDDIVLLGAPGAGRGISSAEDYAAVEPAHTYVVAFDQDPITQAGVDVRAWLLGDDFSGPAAKPFGPDPAAAPFGAQVVDAETNEPVDVETPVVAAVAGAVSGLGGLAHHRFGNYLRGSSGSATASVVTGRYADVPTKAPR